MIDVVILHLWQLSILVQVFVKEADYVSLCLLQRLLLRLVIRVSSCSKAMVHLREVDVFPVHARLGQRLQSVRLQLLCVRKIIFRCQDLHRHLHVINLRLVKQRWVGGRDSVDECGVGRELEAGPAAVTEAYGSDFGVLLLELLRRSLDLGPALFLVIAANERHDVELFGFLGVGHGIGIYDFAVKAFKAVSAAWATNTRARDLLVDDIYCRLRFFRVVIRKDSNVRQSPAEDVTNDQNRGIFAVTGYVGLVVAEGAFFANGLAVPGKAFLAIFADHVFDVMLLQDEELERTESGQ